MITPLFQNQFISQSMHQMFTRAGSRPRRNENEPPLRRYLRLSGQL